MKHKKILVVLVVMGFTSVLLMGCKNDSVPATLPNTLTIIFDSKGGSEVARQTIEVGNRVTKPTEPTKKDAIFDGWYNTTEEYDFSSPIVKNMILYAKWIYNKEVSPQNVEGIFEGVAKGETVALKATGKWTASDMTLLRIVLLENKGIRIRVDLSDSGLKEIPIGMLRSCSNLESIVLPASLETIGSSAFSGCSSLVGIDLSGTALTTIEASAFSGCSSLESIVLPASLTSIGSSAFSGCSSLVRINLSSTALTSIGDSTFSGCSSLVRIDLSSTALATIGASAFYGCSSLASIDLSSSQFTSTGTSAFSGCSSLASIDLPASLKTIELRAFLSCNSLVTVTVRATNPPSIGSAAFLGCTSLAQILVPSNCVETYKAASDWSDYREIIQAIQ